MFKDGDRVRVLDVHPDDAHYRDEHHVDHLKAGIPVFAQWDLTNKCNHRCKTCYSYYGENFEFGDEWRIVAPLDGICDGRQEQFEVSLTLPSGADNMVTVKVVDEHGNVGVHRTEF